MSSDDEFKSVTISGLVKKGAVGKHTKRYEGIELRSSAEDSPAKELDRAVLS